MPVVTAKPLPLCLLLFAGVLTHRPARNLPAHYNIAPTDPVEVVRPAAGGASELVSMRWGLVPWWWKKPLKQVGGANLSLWEWFHHSQSGAWQNYATSDTKIIVILSPNWIKKDTRRKNNYP